MVITLSKKPCFKNPCYKTTFEKPEKQENNTGSTDGNPLTFELYITDTDTAVYI